MTALMTAAAPASRSARALAERVAPVVITSSTTIAMLSGGIRAA